MTPAGAGLKICKGEESLCQTVLEIFFTLHHQSVLERGSFTVVLSGGKTPEAVYSALADPFNQSKIDWTKIHLFWGDERFVPPTHPESNYGAVRKLLISKVSIPPSNVHSIQTGEADPIDAATNYEAQLRRYFKIQNDSFPRFDLVLLGVGEDGHTASLFPESPGLDEQKRWVVSPYIEKLKSQRITMTLPVLNHAKNILVLAAGEKKAEILKRIFKAEPRPPVLPIQQIHPVSGQLIFLLDQAAASFLL